MLNFNRKPHPDDLLIEEARMAADSDWEEEFVANIIRQRNLYGAGWRMTEAQHAKLAQITGQEELDDGFDRRF